MEQDQINVKTPEFVSIQFQLAGLGSRALAFMIDQLLLIVTNIVLLLILLFVILGSPDLQIILEANSYIFAIAIIGIFILQWGYFLLMEYFYAGQTLGKKIIGIRVIQENGHSLTFLSCLIRNLLRIIDSLPTSYFLGIVMIFFHPRKKRIGDLVGGTIVIHERKRINPHTKQFTALEQFIISRGLKKDSFPIDDFALKSISQKEWNLLQTFCYRFLKLPSDKKHLLSYKVGKIILPSFGISIEGKEQKEIEDLLFVIYLNLKDEWEYTL